jgi:hypothetical protein
MYAQKNAAEHSAQTDSTDAVCRDVCRVLSDNGIEFDALYGRSKAKIDIAVKHLGEYILAVECDGGAYAEARSATDRERLRPGVLSGCGWRYHRIYSTDWYRNRREEI